MNILIIVSLSLSSNILFSTKAEHASLILNEIYFAFNGVDVIGWVKVKEKKENVITFEVLGCYYDCE